LLSLDGTLTEAPTFDATLRSPSPDGKWEFGITHDHKAGVFVPLDGGGKPVSISLGPWILGNSWWSHGDLFFASAATGYKVSSPSAVLLLDPAKGTMLPIPGTQGA